MHFSWNALIGLVLTSAGQGQTPSHPQIDAIVKEALQYWKAPGLAVAIVYDQKVVYLHGVGVKEAGKLAPVTPDTVFPLASCSKPLTAMALAMLADEGKLHWDDPVRKHLPWFKLSDPLADAQVTLRDLLCHRTGLGKHDALWYRTPLTMEERARRLGFLELSQPFRSTFEYQAIAYGAAGLAGAAASGTPWQDLIQKRLLGPLDMKSASAVFPGPNKMDYASPHRRSPRGVVQVIDRYPLEHPDPAGSIHASVRDLAKFLRFELAGGVWQGQRLVSRDNFHEVHEPQNIIRGDEFSRALNPFTHVISYTLGWFAQDYRGRWILLHGGQVSGFRAQLTLVPDARLGIALLNNLDRTWMNFALSNTLVDRFCQLPAKNWNEHCQELFLADQRLEQERLQALRAGRKPEVKPSAPLEAYAGMYHDPAYGVCVVRLEKNRLHWEWNSVRSPLDHFMRDTFLPADEPVNDLLLTFQVDAQGSVTALRTMDRTFRRKN